MTKEATSLIVKHGGGYVGERAVIKLALQKGWPGKMPSVLGSYAGDQAVEWAVSYLAALTESTERSQESVDKPKE